MIDKRKAMEALGTLIKQGRAEPADAAKYQKSVDQGLSYADVILLELGEEVGAAYLKEEFVQALHFSKKRIEFDKVSVPEILLIENSDLEPWHDKKYSLLSGQKKFEQEAAEPWHPSLRKKFAPDADVSLWFNRHPRFFEEAVKVLTTVYGRTPPNEDDLAKMSNVR
jgi:hypothetical protein